MPSFGPKSVFHCVARHASFILTPTNAPAWAHDREQLWNAVERSENRKNSVVARELEISIPRDIPESEWQNFAQEIVQKYVDAGAIADVAIHCPIALDKQPQPHLHIMLSLRKLDHTTEHGFSKNKNDDLIRLFESGGRLGGERKDALNNERERIANIMNSYLIQSGSEKRADHRSYRDRGIDKTAEPLLGEQRIRAAKSRKKGDRRTNEVFMLRKQKQHEAKLNQTLINIEESIMKDYPNHQSSGVMRPSTQQNYKAKLINDRFPDINIDHAKIHMVDNRQNRFRAQMRDGSWLELSNSGRALQTYGGPDDNYADVLAAKIAEAGFVDDVSRLQESNTFSKRNMIMRILTRRPYQTLQKIYRKQQKTTSSSLQMRGTIAVIQALSLHSTVCGYDWVLHVCRTQAISLKFTGKSTIPLSMRSCKNQWTNGIKNSKFSVILRSKTERG